MYDELGAVFDIGDGSYPTVMAKQRKAEPPCVPYVGGLLNFLTKVCCRRARARVFARACV